MDEQEELDSLFGEGPLSDAPTIIVYTTADTARLRYTCRFVFNRVLRLKFEITTDESTFLNSPHFKVNYSFRDFPFAFRVKPHSLCITESMMERQPAAFYRDSQLYFFPNTETLHGLHFDVFSAVFYFISRHEEWQDFVPDRHQRFEAAESILHKCGFLLKPVVDQWILEFAKALRRLYGNLKLPERKFRVISTIDVDNLYAYKGKGLVRNLGGLVRDMVRGRPDLALERIAVISGFRSDPFDVYSKLSEWSRELGIPLFFFFLLRHDGRYDRTIDPDSGVFEPVFRTLAPYHKLGIHPSYGAAYNSSLLQKELDCFRRIASKPVKISRQHYLRFDVRKTPQMLQDQGIVADFTMGFAGAPGFRAGTSFPFYYYDFRKEQETKLLFVPFCFMDGVYSVYQRRNPVEALPELLAIAKEVESTGGFFITVFHERSFSNRLYKGFASLYKNLHSKASGHEPE